MYREAFIIAATVLALATSAFSSDDMYMYTDENGVVVFTDQPNQDAVNSSKYKSREPSGTIVDYQGIIRESAERHGVDHSLVNAVIRVESNFNENAVSPKGALGLMQLMPDTAAQLGVYNPLNPEQNIDAGIRYLKYLIDRFEGDLRLALAAYNAGPRNVERYGDVPPIAETREYLEKVFSLYKGKTKLEEPVKKRRPVYRLVLEDGTILYTNSEKYLGNASEL